MAGQPGTGQALLAEAKSVVEGHLLALATHSVREVFGTAGPPKGLPASLAEQVPPASGRSREKSGLPTFRSTSGSAGIR